MSQRRALQLITTLRYALKQDMTIAHAVNGVGVNEGIDRKLQRIAAELVPEPTNSLMDAAARSTIKG